VEEFFLHAPSYVFGRKSNTPSRSLPKRYFLHSFADGSLRPCDITPPVSSTSRTFCDAPGRHDTGAWHASISMVAPCFFNPFLTTEQVTLGTLSREVRLQGLEADRSRPRWLRCSVALRGVLRKKLLLLRKSITFS
jgi:hypothetical protein